MSTLVGRHEPGDMCSYTIILTDSVSWYFYMRALAARATARRGKTFSVFKNIPAIQAPEREYNKPFVVCQH